MKSVSCMFSSVMIFMAPKKMAPSDAGRSGIQ
jgi:hypothetical protein